MIHLVGENANVKIVGDLDTGKATSLQDFTGFATLIINEYKKHENRNLAYDNDALIGGSAGDTIGDITIENAIIEFDYSTGGFFCGALIGSGTTDGSVNVDVPNYNIGLTGELKVTNSIINATITSIATGVYLNASVLGGGAYSSCGNITVDGSTITLTLESEADTYFNSPLSAVIGTGVGSNNAFALYNTPNITVTNSTISADYNCEYNSSTIGGSLIGSGQGNKVGYIDVSRSTLTLNSPISLDGSVIGTGRYSLFSEGEITVDSTDITVNFSEKGNSIAGGSIIGVGNNTAGTGGTKRTNISVSGGTITINNLDNIYGCVIGLGRSSKDKEVTCTGITVDGVQIDIKKVTPVTTDSEYPLGVVIGVGPLGSVCQEIVINSLGGISIDTEDGESPVQPFIGSCKSSVVENNITIKESKDSFLSKIILTEDGQKCDFPDDAVKVGCIGNNEEQNPKVIWSTDTASTN